MSKKILIFGLFMAILTSSVGGVLTSPSASADHLPYGSLGIVPSSYSVNSGDWVSFTASYIYGGTYPHPLTWQAVGGNPTSGTGTTFGTRFYTSISESRMITVSDGYQTAAVNISVNGTYVTPTPTPWYGSVVIDHTVRNITRGGEGSWVTAYPADRLQFIARITTGNQYAGNVHLHDFLPQYMTYVSGSTNVDGAWYVDGIASPNTYDSLALGTLSPNRTYTVRFDATLQGTNSISAYTLTNTLNVHVNGMADQSRSSMISVVGGTYVTPTVTPTVSPVISGQLSVTERARNVTRGQTGENISVSARGGDTLDIIAHIRNTSSATLTNVFVTDLLPLGLSYINNSTTINGIVAMNGLTSSGLNIGSLIPNQSVTVKFSATVNASAVPATGRLNVVNSFQIRADGVDTRSIPLTISLGQTYLGSIGAIQTGPVDSMLLAALVASLMTVLYAGYTRTNLFGRRYAVRQIHQIMAHKTGTNFVR